MKLIANIFMSLVILATAAFSGFLGYVAFNQRERIVKLEKQITEIQAEKESESGTETDNEQLEVNDNVETE